MRRTTAVAVICLLPVLARPAGRAQERSHSVKANVHFLATSTSVRSNLGESEDVYLADIRLLHADGEIISARLIDDYPPDQIGIPPAILGADGDHMIRVRRDRSCDRSFGLMPMRTAPGDLMAILPVHLSFTPSLPWSVESNEILPCYRTVRR